MKKVIFLIGVFIFGTSEINAQAFKLLGQRDINLNNWFFPDAQFSYNDSDGNPYLFLNVNDDEAFKRVTLIRFNVTTNAWEDIIGTNYLLNFPPKHSQGVGLADGSCFVVTKRETLAIETNTLYQIFPNGIRDFIGPNPVPSNITSSVGIDTDIAMSSNGAIYYGGSTLFGDQNEFKKWNGTQWVQLPSIVEAVNNVKDISLSITNNGEIYAAYSHTVTNADLSVHRNKKIVKLNANETAWELVYTSPFEIDSSVSSGELYTKNNEVFMLAVGRTGQGFDTAFKLIHKNTTGNWSQLGPDLEIGVEIKASLLKANAGDIYVAPGGGADINIYKLNTASNTWEPLQNDIADGGPVSGSSTFLTEGKDGKVYNIFQSAIHSFTGVVYDPRNANLSTVDLATNNSIGIYPNPFSDSFNIKIPKNINGNLSYVIIDAVGRVVSKGNVNQSDFQVSTNELIKGVYVVNVKDSSNKTILSKKVIKK